MWIAQKHNLKIPCILTDWVGDFSNYKEVRNELEIRKMFKDNPQKVIINKDGVSIGRIPENYLENL